MTNDLLSLIDRLGFASSVTSDGGIHWTIRLHPSGRKAEGLDADPVNAVLAAVNEVRAAAKLPPLKIHPDLVKSAQGHSDDMAKHGRLTHSGSDWSSPSTRMTAAGYKWQWNGECIAWNYPTADAVVKGWMSDLPHRAILLGGHYTHLGVGVNNLYWTLDAANGMPDPAPVPQPEPSPPPLPPAPVPAPPDPDLTSPW